MSESNSGGSKAPLLIFAGLGCMFLCGGVLIVGIGVLMYFGARAEVPDSYTTLYEPAPPPVTAMPAPPIPTDGDGAGARIRSLGATGGSSEWDTAVKPVMLGAYDLNGSGGLNNGAEIAAVPCDTWYALDVGVKQSWDYGLRTIYGFEENYSWVGDAIGVDEAARPWADHALARCLGGTPSTFVLPGGVIGGVVGGGVTGGSDGSVATSIRGRSETGGSSSWDAAVKVIMLAQFDTNRSGWIDTSTEASAIGCDVWRALDDGVKESWSYGLRSIYGFDQGLWIGDAIGISQGVRAPADAKLTSCGLN